MHELTRSHNPPFNIDTAQDFAALHNLPMDEVAILALNTYGLQNGTSHRQQIPFTIPESTFVDPEQDFFIVVPGHNSDSPFHLRDRQVVLGDTPVANIIEQNEDAAIAGYFRKWQHGTPRALTFNPNARSRCNGCAFCPTVLEGKADPRNFRPEGIKARLGELAWESPNGLETIEDITVSTGCFPYESMAVDFLRNLRQALVEKNLGHVSINYLTSEIRTPEALQALREVGPLTIYLTLEHMQRRRLLLKASKAALQAADVVPLAERIRSYDIGFTYNYISGLDNLGTMVRWSEALAPYVTSFPNFQIFQPHNTLMRNLQAYTSAEAMTYQLQARQEIEAIFSETQPLLTPDTWRNYRSLTPLSYNGKPLPLYSGMNTSEVGKRPALVNAQRQQSHDEVPPTIDVTNAQKIQDGRWFLTIAGLPEGHDTYKPLRITTPEGVVRAHIVRLDNGATLALQPDQFNKLLAAGEEIQALDIKGERDEQTPEELRELLDQAQLLEAFQALDLKDRAHIIGIIKDVKHHWEGSSRQNMVTEAPHFGLDLADLSEQDMRLQLRKQLLSQRFAALVLPAVSH